MSQATFKGVVKLSQTQYETLKSSGTLTVGDVTLTYDPTTTLYVTPSSGGSGGSGTNVTVGGVVQETWDADTKVNASSSQTQEQNIYTETIQNTNGTLSIQSTNNDGKVFTDITSNSGGIKFTQNVYHDDWATPDDPAIVQTMDFNSRYGLQLTALDNRSNSGSGLLVGSSGDGLQLVATNSHITLGSDEIHIADSSSSNDFATFTSDQIKFDKKSGSTMEGNQIIDGKSITLSQFLTESETSTSNVSLRLAVKGSDTSDTVSNFSISTKDDTVTHTLEFKNGQLLIDGSELGGGSVDLSNYVDLTSAQTITGIKTFDRVRLKNVYLRASSYDRGNFRMMGGGENRKGMFILGGDGGNISAGKYSFNYNPRGGYVADYCIAMGYNSGSGEAGGTGTPYDYIICLGYEARAEAANVIQLGTGTNSTEKTLQIWDYQLLDGNTGKIPNERLNLGTKKYLHRITLNLSDQVSGTAPTKMAVIHLDYYSEQETAYTSPNFATIALANSIGCSGYYIDSDTSITEKNFVYEIALPQPNEFVLNSSFSITIQSTGSSIIDEVIGYMFS